MPSTSSTSTSSRSVPSPASAPRPARPTGSTTVSKGFLSETWNTDPLFKSYRVPSAHLQISVPFYEFLSDKGSIVNPFIDSGSDSNLSDSSSWGTSMSDDDRDSVLEDDLGEPVDPLPISEIYSDFLSDPFIERIQQGISDCRGHVFCKIDSKCPFDSKWMYGTLEICTVEQLVMVLRASYRIPPVLSPTSTLVLKKYLNLQNMLEFRLVIYGYNLYYVLQRRYDYFPDLVSNFSTIEKHLDKFIPVMKRYLEKYSLSGNVVADIVIMSQFQMYLLDIHPLDETTTLVDLDIQDFYLETGQLESGDTGEAVECAKPPVDSTDDGESIESDSTESSLLKASSRSAETPTHSSIERSTALVSRFRTSSGYTIIPVTEKRAMIQPSSNSISGLPQELYQFPNILQKLGQEQAREESRKRKAQSMATMDK